MCCARMAGVWWRKVVDIAVGDGDFQTSAVRHWVRTTHFAFKFSKRDLKAEVEWVVEVWFAREVGGGDGGAVGSCRCTRQCVCQGSFRVRGLQLEAPLAFGSC